MRKTVVQVIDNGRFSSCFNITTFFQVNCLYLVKFKLLPEAGGNYGCQQIRNGERHMIFILYPDSNFNFDLILTL